MAVGVIFGEVALVHVLVAVLFGSMLVLVFMLGVLMLVLNVGVLVLGLPVHVGMSVGLTG